MFRLVLTIAIAAMLCAGCSEGDGFGLSAGSGDSGETHLRAALGRVAANDRTRQYVEYGDVALLSKLAGKGERYLTLLGYGFSPIATTYRLMADELHFDPTAMDGAVMAGQPPDQAGVLWGDYDVDAVERELADRDIPAEDNAGGKLWTSADDHELNVDGPFADIAPTSQLNDIHTASGTFAYSSSRAGVDSVTAPGDHTLADDPLLRRLAGCLGDVSAATLLTEAKDDTTSYAVGVRATSDGAATEVACVAPAGDPKAMRDRVQNELKDGLVPSSQQPWAEVLPAAKVDLVELGSVVRIEAKPGGAAPVGRVMQLLQTRDLAALAGSRK